VSSKVSITENRPEEQSSAAAAIANKVSPSGRKNDAKRAKTRCIG